MSSLNSGGGGGDGSSSPLWRSSWSTDAGRAWASLTGSEEYASFRANVPLRKIALSAQNPEKEWRLYDSGPKSAPLLPLVCLPPVAGTADVFFFQHLGLAARGQRVITVEAPPIWSIEEWCTQFRQLLDHLGLGKVYLFGSALGGFLAQKFAEFVQLEQRVESLILCNSFIDTNIFKCKEQAQMFWLMPATLLKSMLTPGLQTSSADPMIMQACAFMSERLESLRQSALASRLQLNCMPCRVKACASVQNIPITIIDVFDECALEQSVRDELYSQYPNAKLAHLKTGGNFPFLSRSEEINMHLLIHLRNAEKVVEDTGAIEN